MQLLSLALLSAGLLQLSPALRIDSQPSAQSLRDTDKQLQRKAWAKAKKKAAAATVSSHKSHAETFKARRGNPHRGELFFMHLPKAAGDSFLKDVPGYSGRELKGAETNFCKARNGVNGTMDRGVVAMMREPRAHVLSMYYHCKTGHEYIVQGWDRKMPSKLIDWLRPWSKAGPNDEREVLHRFCCYDPVNLQSRRFSCSQSMETAKRNIAKSFFVGLVEHYHVSLCMFSVKVTGIMPPGCNCADKEDVTLTEDSHDNHGVQDHSVDSLPTSHLELIDNITREDVAIYEHTRKRFWAEVEKIEKAYRVRVVCGEERRRLHAPYHMPPLPKHAPPRPPSENMPTVEPTVSEEEAATKHRAPPRGPPPVLNQSFGFEMRTRSPPRPPSPFQEAARAASLLSLDSKLMSRPLQARAASEPPPQKKDQGFCENEGYLLHGTR